MFSFFKKPNINDGVAAFQRTEGAVLLDVRTKEEFLEGNVPSSIHVDVAQIATIQNLVHNKNTPLFVYCLSGGRSSVATAKLESMGYTNVTNIGGIRAYTGEIRRGA